MKAPQYKLTSWRLANKTLNKDEHWGNELRNVVLLVIWFDSHEDFGLTEHRTEKWKGETIVAMNT